MQDFKNLNVCQMARQLTKSITRRPWTFPAVKNSGSSLK